VARPGEADARERILDAAVRLFARQGYEGAAIAEIAGQAGVNRGLPFYYWSSKRALYAEAVHLGLDGFSRMVAETLGGTGSFSDRLGAFVAGHLRLLWHQGDRMRVVDRCLLDGHVVELGLAERFGGTIELLERFFREAGESGEFRPADPAFMARLMLGPGFIFSMWKLFEGDRHSEAELAERITEQLLIGLRSSTSQAGLSDEEAS
jgi:AcrR family transcriptional regulator